MRGKLGVIHLMHIGTAGPTPTFGEDPESDIKIGASYIKLLRPTAARRFRPARTETLTAKKRDRKQNKEGCDSACGPD